MQEAYETLLAGEAGPEAPASDDESLKFALLRCRFVISCNFNVFVSKRREVRA